MINFRGRHFQKDIILMSVRWYVSYALSYRDIEELMAERGLSIPPLTAGLLNTRQMVIPFKSFLKMAVLRKLFLSNIRLAIRDVAKKGFLFCLRNSKRLLMRILKIKQTILRAF